MRTNIAAYHPPALSSDFDHLLPVSSQRHRLAYAWIIERRLADIHHKRIPSGAWPEGHDRVGKVLFQNVGLGPFEMARDSRHGQLPHPEGGEDLGEILHHHGLVSVDVW